MENLRVFAFAVSQREVDVIQCRKELVTVASVLDLQVRLLFIMPHCVSIHRTVH